MQFTQQIVYELIKQRVSCSLSLLFEALLWRGFLAILHNNRIFLARGSHYSDLKVLSCIDGLQIIESEDSTVAAEVKIQRNSDPLYIAKTIISLPHHDHTMCAVSVNGFWGAPTWSNYKKMKWGAKCPVCPTENIHEPHAHNALDTGVALLVKALPLARVATTYSCDGHGERGADVWFYYLWDELWSRAIFSVLGGEEKFSCNSSWEWKQKKLRINPNPPQLDGNSCLLMFYDIQKFSRALMDPLTILKIEVGRRKLLDELHQLDKTEGSEFFDRSLEILKSQFN